MTATSDTSIEAPATTCSSDIAGLDRCKAPAVVELAPGDACALGIATVVKQIGENRVRLIAHHRPIPGPTLRDRQGSDVSVRVRSDADNEATVLLEAYSGRLERRLSERYPNGRLG